MRPAEEPAGEGLDERRLAPTWLEQFRSWAAAIEQAGVAEPQAMVLATAATDGQPSARSVLLKGVGEGGFEFFTNLESRKGSELAANPLASLVFPWYELRRQVIVIGAVEPVGEERADEYFATRPHGSKLGALASRQSSVIPSREPLEHELAELERRYPPGSEVPRPAHWSGFRLVPESVEFWQGRRDRLHDRLRYHRTGERWAVERLSP
ncbi:MAG: pyridoxamine 5'-phosphate oxidase [Solirubrobacteraceae bacterium]